VLLAALAIGLLAILGPQPSGVAVTPEPSPASLESAALSMPTSTAHFGRSADSSTTTTQPTIPHGVHPPTTKVQAVSTPTTPTKKASSPTTTVAAPTTTAAQGGFSSEYESQFAGKINSLRTSNGLAALSRNGSLDAEARSWAKSMGGAGNLSHSNLSRLVPPWSSVAENVGAGGSVDSVFSLLAGSGSHRSNMVGDYTHLGVGVWVDSSGKLWTVHLFAR
jgi:uncharacterized protein YkwD